MSRITGGCFLIIAMACAAAVSAQGMLLTDNHDMTLPRHRPGHRPAAASYRIKSIEVNSRIDGQVAVTQVAQTFINTGRRQIEASFVFPLPYDGAVDRMTFLVDGREYEAKLLPASKAREIYEGYVRRNQDPALLEWMGQGMFKTSVFPIPAGASRTVELRYTQLLRRDAGVNDYLIPMSTARYTDQPVETFSVRAAINTTEKLKSIYSPTHAIQVDRSGDNLAVVSLKQKNFVPARDVRILFGTDSQSVGASLMSHWPSPDENGYFTLLVSPEIRDLTRQKTKKTVIFVVDKSGSMNGKKIEQAREAAKFVLNNLRDGDLFNIVTYSDEVEAFEPELQVYDSQNRTAALGFVESIFAGGSTNIDAALTKTFAMTAADAGPTYVVFLTDGLPTKGETSELRIAANAKRNNRHGARLISFGVGFDVNSRLLDRITRENNGQSQYVRPDENLEEHVSNLYAKIAAPVLSDVKVEYLLDGKADEALVNRVYPAHTLDLFAGQQLVLVGRYRRGGTARLSITGKVGEQPRRFEYDVTFASSSGDTRYSFTARLWAARRIGEIIDLIDLEGKNPELVEELVRLSTKHGIVTPYTSYLADDLAPPSDLADRRLSLRMAGDNLMELEQTGGQRGFAQRGIKQRFKSAGQDGPVTGASAGELDSLRSGRVPASGHPPAAAQGGGGGLGTRTTRNADGEPDSRFANRPSPVRSAGRFTAYLRGNLLIASNATEIDPEKDKDKIREIERYSAEYFELLKSTSREENQLLALQHPEEEMLVRLQGVVYRLK